MSVQKPSINGELFLKELDETILNYSMLKHPFYRRWSEGKLSREVLAEYSKQYYAHVQAFPTYVSGVHSNCPDLTVRQMLLENLIEEERGPENHPELWVRFAEGIGVKREEIERAELLPFTVDSVHTIKKITTQGNYLGGLAGLYSYESQIPKVARTKREGLGSYYGITEERSVQFFRVHEEADIYHCQVEREILEKKCDTRGLQEEVIHSAAESAKALWLFLDGVHREYLGEEDNVDRG